MKLKNILSEAMSGLPMMKVISNPFAKSFAVVNEAEDDRYVHIGYGKYKEKGKEGDKSAPTFTKDDSGKYVPTSGGDSKPQSDKGGETKPNMFAKGYDAPDLKKDEPKSDSSSEPDYDKYTNKSQTMTDFFKGELSIDDLQKVAKKNFDSEIATERDLDGFLNNKFMQDTMSDEYGIDRETLVSKVKDLKTALFGGKEEPKGDTPSSEPSQPKRQGDPQVNKATLLKAKKLGITPQKLGKEEYQKKMAQAAVAALTDANFHSEARELIAKLAGKPEWNEDPRKSAPKIDSPEYDKWRETSVYSSDYYDAEGEVEELGIDAANNAGWDGGKAADSIAYTLRKNGFDKLADSIQSVIKENKSTKLKDLV